jgi:hypothetical protein
VAVGAVRRDGDWRGPGIRCARAAAEFLGVVSAPTGMADHTPSSHIASVPPARKTITTTVVVGHINGRSTLLQTEVASDGVLDLCQFVTFEVVHGIPDNVVDVDAANLVDEEPGLASVDLQ